MAQTEKYHILDLPNFEGEDKVPHILVVVAPYYADIAKDLVTGAQAKAAEVNAKVDVIEVPGALEIPPTIALAKRLKEYDGYVSLGCVIRGETTHYETVCNDSSRGLMLLGLEGTCIGNGILTVENMEQAKARAAPEGENKGGNAMAAALHLVALSKLWHKGDKKRMGFCS